MPGHNSKADTLQGVPLEGGGQLSAWMCSGEHIVPGESPGRSPEGHHRCPVDGAQGAACPNSMKSPERFGSIRVDLSRQALDEITPNAPSLEIRGRDLQEGIINARAQFQS